MKKLVINLDYDGSDCGAIYDIKERGEPLSFMLIKIIGFILLVPFQLSLVL